MEIREYIITEADKLFCQYGFKAVTMDDIAKTLGMSKKTIYQHFVDKDELVNILISEKLQNQDCKMDELHKLADNAVHELLITVTNMNELLSNIHARLFFDLQKYHPKAWLYFREYRDKKVHDSIMQNIERGLKEGLYREGIQPEILTRMRLEQVDLLFSNNDHYTANKFSLAEVMTEITEHFLYGLCTPKGYQMIEKYKQQNKHINNSAA